MEFEDEFDLMEAFAKACATGGDPFAHAQRLVPGQQGKQLEMCNEWPKRVEFVEMLADYKAQNPTPVSDVPTRDALISALWSRIQSPTEQLKDITAAAKTVAEIMNFIDKTPAVQINNTVNNKVMRVPVQPSLDDWEKRSQKQQSSLVDNAATRH